MVRRRWARRQVRREKREKRWSPTMIENWAKSQGCCSVGNLNIFTDWSRSLVTILKAVSYDDNLV